MNPAKLQTILFDLRQLVGLSLVIDGKMIDSISVSSLLKSGVVQLTQENEPGLEDGDGFSRRLQFVLVGLHRSFANSAGVRGEC
jgi:hypothetical protein